MMNWIVSTSLNLRIVVVALGIVLMIAGIQIVRTTPLDVFPEFAPPLVEIQTEAPGLSTAEVESLISAPIENSLNGITSLKTLRSKSVLGLSSVVLIFQEGTDLMRARQLVQERLAIVAGQLPTIAHPPVILSPLSSTSRVMKIGMSSATLSQMDLTTLARWTIRPRLMSIPGVANVAIWGQRDRQIQVLVDPDNLRAHNVTLDDVVRASRDAVSPAAGGFIDTPNQRLALTHLSAVVGAEDLARVPVSFRAGSPLQLGDVAAVVEGHPAPIGDAVINDGPGLLLIVEKQPEGNTLEVTRNVEAALDALRPGLKDVEVDSTIFRPATFIEMALENLRRALLIGCVLVVIVLVAFLYDWRTALISLAGDTALAAHRSAGASLSRLQHQHDGDRRSGDRAGGGGRRRDHRRRKHHAAPAPQSLGRKPAAGASSCAEGVDRSSKRNRLCHADSRACLSPGLFPGWIGGFFFSPSGILICARGNGFAGRGADLDSRVLIAAAATRSKVGSQGGARLPGC